MYCSSVLALLSFILLFFFFFLYYPLPSCASLRRSTLLGSDPASHHHTHSEDASITTYFEVTKPINLPETKPCSHLVLKHNFGSSYGLSPVRAIYNPPSNCPCRSFSKIVLEWKSRCKGRQLDRIFGVWLGGVELLRSCTAEPRAAGIVWKVEKDITRYSSLLMKNNQTLAVYLGNLVDKTYTGVYHAAITLHFYSSKSSCGDPDWSSGNLPADLILPISRKLPLDDAGLWFEITNSIDIVGMKFEIPQNAYRAVLEVYVSFHQNDEFWYTNVPNEYIAKNNLTGTPGNGSFREVVMHLDDCIVGAVWPFTVVYTGGINPLLWRPVTGIGSFHLPSYDIEITPFLGAMLDGKPHKLGFSVTNGSDAWYVDANLHLWLDPKSAKTEGALLKRNNLPLRFRLSSTIRGLDGTFLASVSRTLSATGWVNSSLGNITTQAVQRFSFTNSMVVRDNGSLQILNQTIDFNDTVCSNTPSSSNKSLKSDKRFAIDLHYSAVDRGNSTSLVVANLTLGFNEEKEKANGLKSLRSSLKNLQNGQGFMVVKDGLGTGGKGSTQQVYEYDCLNDCYSRNLSVSNYTFLYDKVKSNCSRN